MKEVWGRALVRFVDHVLAAARSEPARSKLQRPESVANERALVQAKRLGP
jgi:hypothetical protein